LAPIRVICSLIGARLAMKLLIAWAVVH
jgi:hypothetical protein